MSKIRFDYTNSFIKQHELEYMVEHVNSAHQLLISKKGAGSDFLGWVDYPQSFDKEEFERIKVAAKKITKNSEVLIVIGIGGSYLGSKAVIEALTHTFYNELSNDKRNTPAICFAGQNISGTYLKHLIQLVEGKDISINVISKSGTTTEPAIAFRFFKELIESKYGKDEAKDRIFVTTDAQEGALKKLADQEGYESFVIPDNVGGRYSVYTAVGLLPIAAAGIDIDQFMEGALAGYHEFSKENIYSNPCYQYAAIRNILNNKGKDIEIFVSYEPTLSYFAEWWKQLFGESEGKDGKGLYPASVNFSTDLHSLGQIIQDGKRNLFETVLIVEDMEEDLEIPYDNINLDGLNYLSGKSINFVNNKAYLGTLYAHIDGGVPNLCIKLPKLNPYYLGQLIYFFERACAISGYMLGVNPFNQPGVEAYKKNMFGLLGKPGYKKLGEELEKRIK